MDCIYINLASRADRREALERNFEAVKVPGWRLDRFEAVTAADVERMAVPGAVRATEKACVLSHREAIRRSLDADGRVMVVEDDVLFGAASCRAVDIALGAHDEANWDIVFTDVGVGNLNAWPDLARLRRAFDRTHDLQLLSVADLQFGGSMAYVLNDRSKRLMSSLLDAIDTVDLPYDVLLRVLIREFQLKAFVVFPFPTTTSILGEDSDIQPGMEGSLNRVFSLFRRMTWIERDLQALGGEIDALDAASGDPETRLFAVLFQGLVSNKMREQDAAPGG